MNLVRQFYLLLQTADAAAKLQSEPCVRLIESWERSRRPDVLQSYTCTHWLTNKASLIDLMNTSAHTCSMMEAGTSLRIVIRSVKLACDPKILRHHLTCNRMQEASCRLKRRLGQFGINLVQSTVHRPHVLHPALFLNPLRSFFGSKTSFECKQEPAELWDGKKTHQSISHHAMIGASATLTLISGLLDSPVP